MDMPTVYMIGIIVALVVILGVVWLLRGRITGSAEGVWSEDKMKGGRGQLPPAPGQPVDISGSTMLGRNTVQVWRDNTRMVYNKLLNKNRVEVKSPPPPGAPAAPPRQRRRKRKK